MMTVQELTSELEHPDARELLRSAPLTRLAYNAADGLPRVIPIGFHWNEHAIVVCTAPISPKVRALAARPDVALTIDSGTTPSTSKALLIRGVATLETVDGIPGEYLAASAKSLSPSELAEFEAAVRGMYKQMTRISIEPRWARFYDFGAGRVPPFLAKLADDAANG
jgi:hypothetical protein